MLRPCGSMPGGFRRVRCVLRVEEPVAPWARRCARGGRRCSAMQRAARCAARHLPTSPPAAAEH
eukprot:4218652-Pleurochrysis_carterae.AAC.3